MSISDKSTEADTPAIRGECMKWFMLLPRTQTFHVLAK